MAGACYYAPEDKCKRLIPKIMKANQARGTAEVIEHLPSKCKALNSNPSSTSQPKEKESEEK
jgi:hypothetical protein